MTFPFSRSLSYIPFTAVFVCAACVPKTFPRAVDADASFTEVGAMDVPVSSDVSDSSAIDVDASAVCPSTPVQCDAGGAFGMVITDTNNCGGCGVVCPVGENAAAVCQQCACILRCSTGFRDCDRNPGNGCEVSINSDPDNCGSCRGRCSTPQDGGVAMCVSGVCAQ